MTGKTYDRLPPLGLALLAGVSLAWGLNWPIMKVVLTDVPPLYFRVFCLLLGGAGVLALARLGGQSIAVPTGQWPRLAILSFFNIVGWNVGAIYGVMLLPSGRAALLAYTMPLWSSLLSVWVLGERLTARRVVSLLLGLVGIVVLMGGGSAAMLQAPLGVACMIVAAWSWAIGVVLMKRLPVAMGTLSLTGWMMLLGGIPLVFIAVPLETSRLVVPGLWSTLGLLYNLVSVFMFSYWAWMRVVLMVPVSVSSISSLTTPLIGVGSGALLLNEPLGWREGVAALCILGAIAAVSLRADRKKDG